MKASISNLKSRVKRLIGVFLPVLIILSACESSDPEMESTVETCDLVVSIKTVGVEGKQRGRIGEDTRFDVETVFTPDHEEVVRNLVLYIVGSDNTIYPLDSKYIRQEDGVYEYAVKVNVDAEYVTYNTETGNFLFSGRLVAMANMPEIPQPHPFEQPPFPLMQIADLKSIPMWGVAFVKDLRLEPGKTVDLGTGIELLRSVPKFTFTLSDEIKETYIITDITSSDSAFELEAMCQPAGADSIAMTSAIDSDNCFNPAPDDSPKGEINLISGLDSNKVSLYTGERICIGSGELPPYFNVTLKRRDGTGSPITGKAYMCDYINGSPNFSSPFGRIVRNHDYRYEISLSELEMVISFREWIFGGKVHIDLE